MTYMAASERVLHLETLKAQQDNGQHITIPINTWRNNRNGGIRQETIEYAQTVVDQLPSTFRLLLNAFDYKVTLAPETALSYVDHYRYHPARQKLRLSPRGMTNNKTACVFSANESHQWVIIHEIGHCVDGALQLLYVASGHEGTSITGVVSSNRSQRHDFTALAARVVASGALRTIGHLERPNWDAYSEADMSMEVFAHGFQEYYAPVPPDNRARFEETMGELYRYMEQLEKETIDLINVALIALRAGQVDDYLQL